MEPTGFWCSENINMILQSLAVLSAMAVFAWQARSRTLDNGKELYQRLEFASIDLFRFEAEHQEQMQMLYDRDQVVDYQKDPIEFRRLMNHTTSILNLFEMAVEFRRKKITSAEIFATWVPWMYGITKYPNFRRIWVWDEEEGVPLYENYTVTLQKTIHAAIKYNSVDDSDTKEDWQNFLLEIKNIYGQKVVTYLFDDKKDNTADAQA